MNMKKKLLLLVSVCFLIAVSHAQKQTRELKWQDFMKSVQTTIVAKPVTDGEFTIFQITGINKFLYKVEISGSVFELQTPVPTELQSLFRLTPTELQKTVENKKAEEGVATISKAVPPMQELKEKTEKEANNLKNTVAPTLAPNSDTLKKTNEAINEKREFAEDLEELVKACREYHALALQVAKDVMTLKSARSQMVAIAQMDRPKDDIESKLQTVEQPPASIKMNYVALKEKYSEVQSLYNEAAAYATGDDELTEAQQKIKKSLDYITKANDLIEQEALIGLYTDVDFLFTELQNENNFRVVAPPVQMGGDLVRYAVKITPSATRTLGAYRNPMEFSFDVPTRGGLKIDFSVGPAISFGANAKDEKYFLEEVAGQTTVTLRQRDNNNSISPSIGAFMHFYPHTGTYRGFGGLFGVGAGFQNTSAIDVNMFVGVSYIIGKMEKLMLNGGVSYVRVDRLKNKEFEVGKTYEAAKISLNDLTEKVYKPSLFLSITYALSKRVEIK